MSETVHLISDTSHQLNVEPHVLRYWEEELEMKIRRNAMGHRYYTPEDIRVLQTVREMKEQGIQLKAIKQILPELYANPDFNWKGFLMRTETETTEHDAQPADQEAGETAGSPKVVEMEAARANYGKGNLLVKDAPAEQETLTEHTASSLATRQQAAIDQTMSAELKMEQFQEIMTKIIGRALEANNRSLTGAISNEVSDKVSERVIKQMDYVMRENEEREEERFRKLDEAIRMRQKANAEAAATAEEAKKKKKKKLFGKRNKVKPRVIS